MRDLIRSRQDPNSCARPALPRVTARLDVRRYAPAFIATRNKKESRVAAALLHRCASARGLLRGRGLFLDLALGPFEIEDVGLALRAFVLFVIVEVLEAELLLRRKGGELLLFVGPEQAGEGLRLRHPVELVPTGLQPGPSRDELADDDVLLEPEQPILLTHRRGLGEDARGLLERRGREERRRRQRRLRHAEEHRLCRRGLATRRDRAGVDVLELEAIEELHREELGVARLFDADL